MAHVPQATIFVTVTITAAHPLPRKQNKSCYAQLVQAKQMKSGGQQSVGNSALGPKEFARNSLLLREGHPGQEKRSSIE